MSLPSDQCIDRIQLARTRRVGPISYAQLIARFGTARAALVALPDLARRGGGTALTPARRDLAEAEYARTTALGARYIFVDQPDYPNLLRDVTGSPIMLIARGDAALLDRPSVAIVGARNASAAACRFARMLGGALGEAGVVVVSGLARGIDAAAHQGAMNHATIGVIASGIDISFPPENAALQQAIAERHLLLTEYPPGTEPLARQFPHRNRIIAGSTLGTVVVEAAPRSGSLLTARLATEAGREVMAVPGSPLDPRAQGCNLLIREGATLVQSADDIVEALGLGTHTMLRSLTAVAPPPPPPPSTMSIAPDDAARAAVAAMLGPVPVTVDELVRQSGLSTAAIQMLIVELELGGTIERHAGGRISAV